MGARRFKKRIEVWQTSNVADTFGGNTNAVELLTTTWADIRSLSKNKGYSTDFGINNTQLSVVVTVRLRNDLTYNSINQFIKYAGEEYVIVSFPEDKNFDHNYITFVASKRDTKTVTEIDPIE